MPAIHGFEENMKTFTKDVTQVREIVARFDEVIIEKASKLNIDEVYNKLKEYSTIADFTYLEDELKSHREELLQKITELNGDIDHINKFVKSEINSSIRKISVNLRQELKRNTDKGNINREIVTKMISNKIDVIEFENKLSTKSNVRDVETTMKAIDIIHSQIKNMVVILIENLNINIDQLNNVNESEKSKLHKQTYLLNQAKLIAKWIALFDPSNINTIDLKTPKYLEKYQEKTMKSLRNTCATAWFKRKIFW